MGTCFHCGQSLEKEKISFDDKYFCCQGCRSVYEILNFNQLSDFYELNKSAGIRPRDTTEKEFEYLDSAEVRDTLVDFQDGGFTLVTFKIPVIHCTSCIWLLESLSTLNPGIQYSQVNFTRKTVQISIKDEVLKLSELATLLASLGYSPVISLASADQKEEAPDRSLLIKIAISGFAFGNGMFLTFPEYLGGGDIWLQKYANLFRYLMLLLSIPVVTYCSWGYYTSAWYGLRHRVVNIDVPIVLGILVLFFRSLYEVLSGYGAGYFDTLCGLLFFMSLGRYFQKRTYSALSYDRDYKSFYPIAVTRVDFGGKQEHILLSEIKKGDRILVRNQEIIPVDAILIQGEGNIDNSFITGEAATVKKKSGDRIYAGGKQVGQALELEVVKEVDQSYLTQLWNREVFQKQDPGLDTLVNRVSRYFTFVILGVALLAGIYWVQVSRETALQVVSAILIIACPCALALSTPFTMGHMMRILGRNLFYVKDALTIERISRIDTLVFDKTGTLTYQDREHIKRRDFQEVSTKDLQAIKSLTKNSTHPLSRGVYESLSVRESDIKPNNFVEISGKGYQAELNNDLYRIGSAGFIGMKPNASETSVYISKNHTPLMCFQFGNAYREGLGELVERLKDFEIHLLSGDNDSERETLTQMLPRDTALNFNQSPEDKLHYIHRLQQQGKKVMMLGDGLNDAGALKQANIGVAMADDTNAFTPSCDVIMNARGLSALDRYLAVCSDAVGIVQITFAISFIYNLLGIGLAVMGKMQPLFAAILMPASTISIISFTTLATWLRSRRYFSAKTPLHKN